MTTPTTTEEMRDEITHNYYKEDDRFHHNFPNIDSAVVDIYKTGEVVVLVNKGMKTVVLECGEHLTSEIIAALTAERDRFQKGAAILEIQVEDLEKELESVRNHDEQMNVALGKLAPKGTWLCEVLENIWRATLPGEADRVAVEASQIVENIGLWTGPRISERADKAEAERDTAQAQCAGLVDLLQSSLSLIPHAPMCGRICYCLRGKIGVVLSSDSGNAILVRLKVAEADLVAKGRATL